MSDQNIAIRLKFLIENLGISNSQFADVCNISRPTLSQLVTGRNKKVSDVIIAQIHAAYPDLSILWLLFGEGEMWLNHISSPGVEENTYNKYLDIDAGNVMINIPSSEEGGFYSHENSEKNPCENPEIRVSGRNLNENYKDIPLKMSENASNYSNNEEIRGILKNTELLNDLAKMREKPRKVVQVTIYYDDSTFESFYPGK